METMYVLTEVGSRHLDVSFTFRPVQKESFQRSWGKSIDDASVFAPIPEEEEKKSLS